MPERLLLEASKGPQLQLLSKKPAAGSLPGVLQRRRILAEGHTKQGDVADRFALGVNVLQQLFPGGLLPLGLLPFPSVPLGLGLQPGPANGL